MDFVKFLEIVKIDFIESSNCYGHHPMQLAAIDKNGKIELNALLHLKIIDIKNRVDSYLNNSDFKELFLSLDFPANDEITNDFVLILHINEKGLEKSLIKKYDVSTGVYLDVLENSEFKVIKHIMNLLLGEVK